MKIIKKYKNKICIDLSTNYNNSNNKRKPYQKWSFKKIACIYWNTALIMPTNSIHLVDDKYEAVNIK